uniref:DUF4249 family protein n=1 Tax=candidate division WOR-3 bacterium TaxID=2052148 RepID=A0A7C4GEB6_UNCW3
MAAGRCRPLFFVVALALVCGCDESKGRVRDPFYDEPMVNCYLYRLQFYDYSVEYSTYAEVFDNDGLRMVPIVVLNRDTLEPYYYTPTAYRYGHENPFPTNARYDLNVTHYWGRAFSRVVMPGNFNMMLPPERYILGLDSTLVVSWQRSAAAQWYWLDIDLDYEFEDSLGVWDDFELSLDTILTDTVVVIRPGRLFPAKLKIARLVEGDGAAMVWSGNGPAIEPGDAGNVRGDGFGFFNAINEPREKYFYVGAPPLARRCPEARTVSARRLNRLRSRRVDSRSGRE